MKAASPQCCIWVAPAWWDSIDWNRGYRFGEIFCLTWVDVSVNVHWFCRITIGHRVPWQSSKISTLLLLIAAVRGYLRKFEEHFVFVEAGVKNHLYLDHGGSSVIQSLVVLHLITKEPTIYTTETNGRITAALGMYVPGQKCLGPTVFWNWGMSYVLYS